MFQDFQQDVPWNPFMFLILSHKLQFDDIHDLKCKQFYGFQMSSKYDCITRALVFLSDWDDLGSMFLLKKEIIHINKESTISLCIMKFNALKSKKLKLSRNS